MRETAESHDDLAMPLGIAQVAREQFPEFCTGFPCKVGKQPDGIVLVRQRFRMLERQVVKNPFDGPESRIDAPRDAVPAMRPGDRIEEKGAWRVAIDVARKLIRQKN